MSNDQEKEKTVPVSRSIISVDIWGETYSVADPNSVKMALKEIPSFEARLAYLEQVVAADETEHNRIKAKIRKNENLRVRSREFIHRNGDLSELLKKHNQVESLLNWYSLAFWLSTPFRKLLTRPIQEEWIDHDVDEIDEFLASIEGQYANEESTAEVPAVQESTHRSPIQKAN